MLSIIGLAGLASHRRSQLTSNVRQRKHAVIYLQCTKRAQARLQIDQPGVEEAGLSTSKLGAWSVHVIPLAGRLAFLFMNDRSLLSFVIMEGNQRIELADMLLFMESGVRQVGKLLGLPHEPVEELMKDFEEIAIAAAPNRSIIGLLTSLGNDYAEYIADAGSRGAVDMSAVIAQVNTKPRAKLGFATSSEVALELLQQGSAA